MSNKLTDDEHATLQRELDEYFAAREKRLKEKNPNYVPNRKNTVIFVDTTETLSMFPGRL